MTLKSGHTGRGMANTNPVVYPARLDMLWGNGLSLICYGIFPAANLKFLGVSNTDPSPGHRSAHDQRWANQSSSPGWYPREVRKESHFLPGARVGRDSTGSASGHMSHLTGNSTWREESPHSEGSKGKQCPEGHLSFDCDGNSTLNSLGR